MFVAAATSLIARLYLIWDWKKTRYAVTTVHVASFHLDTTAGHRVSPSCGDVCLLLPQIIYSQMETVYSSCLFNYIKPSPECSASLYCTIIL